MSSETSNKIIYRDLSDKIFDKRYNSSSPLRKYAHRAQWQSIMKQVKPGEQVLDAGCGDGVVSCLLAANGCRVTGVDISEPNIERARELARSMGVEDKVTFMVGDAEALPFEAGSFETVISCHVLEHLPSFEKGRDELFRIAKNRVIVALPSLLNLCSMVQVGHGSFWEISKRSLIALPWGMLRSIRHIADEGVDEGYGGNKDLVHIFRFPWVIRKKLQNQNFDIISFEASTLVLPYFSALLPLIRLMDRACGWPFFKNFGYGTTVTLRKK